MKDKFILVMRGLAEDGECCFYLPTSKVSQLRKNPIYSGGFYVFPEGSIAQFSCETAIVIEQYFRLPFPRFEMRYLEQGRNRRLDYLAEIPSSHMDAICQLIEESEQLSPFIKRQLTLQRDSKGG